MKSDELATAAMQTMTTLLLDKAAAAFGDGGLEDTVRNKAAQRVYDAVRSLLSGSVKGSQAFNQLLKHPHDPQHRDHFKTVLAEALRTDLQLQIGESVTAANRSQEVHWQRKLIVRAVALSAAGIALIVWCARIIAPFDLAFPKDSWLGMSPAWSLVFGLFFKLTVLGLGVICMVAGLSAFQRARIKRSHVDPRVNPVPIAAARRLQSHAGKAKIVNAMQAKVFASAVLRPTDIRQRVVETYTPERNVVRRRVRVDVQLPVKDVQKHTDSQGDAKPTLPDELESIYFPVIIPLKGDLLNSLDIYGSDGNALPVLAYREYLQIAAGALRLLLRLTGADPADVSVKRAELRALAEIAQRRLGVNQPVSVGDKLPKLRDAIPPGANADTVMAYAEKLREYYAVVAIVEPDDRGRFTITYEQTIVPKENHKRLAEALGARPVNLLVDLENASTCQSYHLRVACPDYLYLRRQTLHVSRETLQRAQPDAPTVTHTRFQKRLGQPYAHFYARFFPQNAPGHPSPSIRFTFHEVPPASVFRASVAAIACFLLVWAVGVVISRRSDPGTDAPAFLLAFPAVAAAFLGFDKQSRSLLDSTLPARLSLIATALLSMLASALFMADKALTETLDISGRPHGGWIDWPRIQEFGTPILGITSWLWVLLTLLAMLNAVATTCAYFVRLGTFTYFRSRNGVNPGQGVTNHG